MNKEWIVRIFDPDTMSVEKEVSIWAPDPDVAATAVAKGLGEPKDVKTYDLLLERLSPAA